MNDDVSMPDELRLKREIQQFKLVGFATARERGMPTFDDVLHRWRRSPHRGGASHVDLLKAALARVDAKRALTEAQLLRLYAIDVAHPATPERRMEQLRDAISKQAGRADRPYALETIRTDWVLPTERELAKAMLALLVDSAAPSFVQIAPTTRESLSILLTAAALQLVAGCNDHGAWPGTTGPQAKPSFSVSSWAAAALLKVFGEQARPWVDRTEACAMRSYRETHGAFGAVNLVPPDTEPFDDVAEFLPRARLTASAVKLLHLSRERPTAPLRRSLQFLLDSGSKGYWSEHAMPGDEEGFVATTAYVLDALLRVEPTIANIGEHMDAGEFGKFEDRFKQCRDSGFTWLADQQHTHGWWPMVPGDAQDPYVTAHVVGFVWQLLAAKSLVRDKVLRYLRRIASEGGFPATAGGDPRIAPTALIVNGLLRLEQPGTEDLVQGGIGFLAKHGDRQIPAVGAFAATFVLLLGQYGDLVTDGWREQALGAMLKLQERRSGGATPEECVQDALGSFTSNVRSRVQPALLTILRKPPAAAA